MKKILNVIIIIGYIWLSLALIYNQMPPEYTEKLPIDNTTFILSGATLGIVSTVVQVIKLLLNKNTETNVNALICFKEFLNEQDTRLGELDEKTYKQNLMVENLGRVVTELSRVKNIENEKQEKIIELLKRNNELAKVELKSRLTNPLIDLNIKEEIEAILDEEENIL